MIDTQGYKSTLLEFAAKYIWWKDPEDAIRYPKKVISQVMNIGTLEDMSSLSELLPAEYLIGTLTSAEIGQFSDKSWGFWHYRLGLCEFGKVPAMPSRSFDYE